MMMAAPMKTVATTGSEYNNMPTDAMIGNRMNSIGATIVAGAAPKADVRQ